MSTYELTLTSLVLNGTVASLEIPKVSLSVYGSRVVLRHSVDESAIQPGEGTFLDPNSEGTT